MTEYVWDKFSANYPTDISRDKALSDMQSVKNPHRKEDENAKFVSNKVHRSFPE